MYISTCENAYTDMLMTLFQWNLTYDKKGTRAKFLQRKLRKTSVTVSS